MNCNQNNKCLTLNTVSERNDLFCSVELLADFPLERTFEMGLED